MQYVGGKYRLARRIAEVISHHVPESKRQFYYEPFVGGGAAAGSIAPLFTTKYYSDANPVVMLMWRFLYSSWQEFGDPTTLLPDDVTEEDYKEWRESPLSPQKVFVGFGASFGGKYFGGFARNSSGANTYQQSLRSIQKLVPRMFAGEVILGSHSYDGFMPPIGSTIYCDPPYAGTTSYVTGAFDSVAFWGWAKAQALRGCYVFVSEYQAPEGWVPVFEKAHRVTLKVGDNSRVSTEKLFMYVG